MLQNPVGQAYVGSYALMKLDEGCTMVTPGVVVDSGSFVVTKANVGTYDQDRAAKTDVAEGGLRHQVPRSAP